MIVMLAMVKRTVLTDLTHHGFQGLRGFPGLRGKFGRNGPDGWRGRTDTEVRSEPRLNIKTVFPKYGDSHVKDKTVARPSYL